MALTLRNTKGSELTWVEMDNNFTYLDTKIDNTTLTNTSILSNITENNGILLYNGNPISSNNVGTILEFETALLS